MVKYKQLKQSRVWLVVGVLVSFLAILSPVITYFTISKFSIDEDLLSILGTAGDFLGGTTFLLALASILFVISSIMIQKEELELSRKEVRDSVVQLKESNDNMKVQQIETSFFNLINLLNTNKYETIWVEQINENYEPERIELLALKTFYNDTKIDDYELFDEFLSEYFSQDLPLIKLFEDYDYAHYKLNHEYLIFSAQEKDIENFISFIGRTESPYRRLTIYQIKKFLEIYDDENEFVTYVKSNLRRIFEKTKLESIREFNERYNFPLDPFLQSYISIVSLIDSRDEIKDKDFYLRILTGQLKSYEIHSIKEFVFANYNLQLNYLAMKYSSLRLISELEKKISKLENELK